MAPFGGRVGPAGVVVRHVGRVGRIGRVDWAGIVTIVVVDGM